MNAIEHIGNTGPVLITGHYGCGKTNLTLNLALQAAESDPQRRVIVVDMDIVNPYFRASDSMELLERAGVEVVAPNFAGTTLDTPSLSPGILRAVERGAAGETLTLIDVGGDPEGATALARFADAINRVEYKMLYVVNARRSLTMQPEDAFELMREIEHNSGLRATGIVGNTHLHQETTASIVVDALPFTQTVAELTDLPLEFITAPEIVVDEVQGALGEDAPDVLPIKRYVKTPWE
ncbi:MAG: hypothetical protein ACOYIP_03140 [Coriobacteriales bacterium]|jgi:hypothetical protein